MMDLLTPLKIYGWERLLYGVIMTIFATLAGLYRVRYKETLKKLHAIEPSVTGKKNQANNITETNKNNNECD